MSDVSPPGSGRPTHIADTRIIEVSDGAALFVSERSPSAWNTTAVLVHGIGASHHTWDPVAEQLTTHGQRVITYDQRGHGLSRAGVQGHVFARLVADLREIVASVAGDGPVIVVGHSMGSAVALAYLIWERPEAVSAAALLTPVIGAPRSRGQRAAARFAASSLVDRLIASRLGGALILPALVGPEAGRSVRDQVVHDILRSPGRQAITAGLDGLDLTAELTKVTEPIAVVVGDHDRAVPVASARAIADGLPDGRLHVLARVGHTVPLEAPEKVVAVVTGMLAPNTADRS
ncbi:alpha/beta fold hydrolase [Mycobacterium sp. Marseille-P9652]|uniref:alpha/beta fold hydrolase n=1 Tax=Mycobacterium sp. Marseille-P9652 TaxID=2654950 RepID=UPI0018D159F1|nr:alpha/beta fold hydrolase [Mycobacterium sp. Marseille-P9652]